MGEATKIEWTDHTWSPWIGCTKIAPACDGCYAAHLMDTRLGRVEWGAHGERKRTSADYWKQLGRWDAAARREGRVATVFPSLCDPFDNAVDPALRREWFGMIRAYPNLLWLLLTKRPQNIVRMVKEVGFMPSNIALGATCEDRERVKTNLPHLMVAAGLRPRFLFVSAEPLLGDLGDLSPWLRGDVRTYGGPWPVIAHPPCQRWGRFWHGSTREPHQYQLGADDGCFAAALAAVRRWGGVLEHPADSHAWAAFNLNRPDRAGGWIAADFLGGWTCHVEQGHYGHFSRKPTWLYSVGCELPDLIWGAGPQRLHPVALEKHGYAKARRIGMAAMIGGKRKTELREATPPAFRDVLLCMATSCRPQSLEAA